MGGEALRRVARALMLACAVLLMPLAASAAGTGDNATIAPASDLPVPRDLHSDVSHLQVAGIAIGAVAGALLGNFLSGGLMTPLLTAGWADGGAAAAGATGVSYGLSVIATTVTTSLGAFMGSWVTTAR